MPSGRDNQPVEMRLARLEHQHRRLKYMSIVVAVVAALALLAPYSSNVRRVLPNGRIIEAQAFSVVDAEGKPRALLHVTTDGTASLTLNDRDTRTRVSLALNAANEGSLDFLDDEARSRAIIGIGEDRTPLLAFADQRDALRAGLALDRDGSPSLVLVDRNKQARAALRVSALGSPILCLAEDEDAGCRAFDAVAEGEAFADAADRTEN